MGKRRSRRHNQGPRRERQPPRDDKHGSNYHANGENKVMVTNPEKNQPSDAAATQGSATGQQDRPDKFELERQMIRWTAVIGRWTKAVGIFTGLLFAATFGSGVILYLTDLTLKKVSRPTRKSQGSNLNPSIRNRKLDSAPTVWCSYNATSLRPENPSRRPPYST
jgi:hypothetical protein